MKWIQYFIFTNNRWGPLIFEATSDEAALEKLKTVPYAYCLIKNDPSKEDLEPGLHPGHIVVWESR